MYFSPFCPRPGFPILNYCRAILGDSHCSYFDSCVALGCFVDVPVTVASAGSVARLAIAFLLLANSGSRWVTTQATMNTVLYSISPCYTRAAFSFNNQIHCFSSQVGKDIWQFILRAQWLRQHFYPSLTVPKKVHLTASLNNSATVELR